MNIERHLAILETIDCALEEYDAGAIAGPPSASTAPRRDAHADAA